MLAAVLSAPDDDALAAITLAPTLLSALAQSPETIAAVFSPITTQAAAVTILNPMASAALATEVHAAAASAGATSLTELPAAPSATCSCPASARVGSLLARVVLPQLLRAAKSVAPEIVQAPTRRALRSATVVGGVALCDLRRSYALRYRPASTGDDPADRGRVFACHVDDCDITLATCLGAAAANDDDEQLEKPHTRGWLGADLLYVDPLDQLGVPRPGTPDLNDPSVVVRRHVHAAGVGVLHGAEAYHYVSPMEVGERATLVTQAMIDDGATWKRDFLRRETTA